MCASSVGKLSGASLRFEYMNESTAARDPISVRRVVGAFPVQLICGDTHQFMAEPIKILVNNPRKSSLAQLSQKSNDVKQVMLSVWENAQQFLEKLFF